MRRIYPNDKARQAAYTHRRRLRVIQKLGGKCVKCGFDDWHALQVDHVNGDGYKDRRNHNTNRSYFDYALINSGQADGKYQLLCANCNWIKRYENKEVRK